MFEMNLSFFLFNTIYYKTFIMASYKLKINSIEKAESLLQEIYDDSVKQQNLMNTLITELRESTKLVDEPIESKTKFAKSINDFAVTKDKAIGRKLDVAKVLAEILKQGGNIDKVLGDDEILENMNLGDEFRKIKNQVFEPTETQEVEPQVYITNSTKKR